MFCFLPKVEIHVSKRRVDILLFADPLRHPQRQTQTHSFSFFHTHMHTPMKRRTDIHSHLNIYTNIHSLEILCSFTHLCNLRPRKQFLFSWKRNFWSVSKSFSCTYSCRERLAPSTGKWFTQYQLFYLQNLFTDWLNSIIHDHFPRIWYIMSCAYADHSPYKYVIT